MNGRTLIRKVLWICQSEGFRGLARRVLRRIKYRDGPAPLVSNPNQRRLLEYVSQCSNFSQINTYDVLFFSIINWDFRFQRPQQIATRFAREGHRVFYISVDLQKQSSYTSRLVLDNLYEIILPYNENTTIYNTDIQRGAEILITAMRDLFGNFRIKEAVSFVNFPLWYFLAKHLQQEYGTKIVFDCLDKFSEFKEVAGNIAAVEEMLIKDSDFCIVTSSKLYDKVKEKSDNVVIVRNGAEFEHFHKLPPNNELEDIKKPIIGYYGAIAEWFDTAMIEYVALQRPDWHIVLIGHTFGSDIHTLKRYKNVQLLGEKPYAKLPEFLYWFDVCIIPFKLNELTLSTNPVKFYEFISSGKPVVSSLLPELLPYKEFLYLCSDKKEFLENIEVALKENDENLVKRRIEFAKTNDWDNRFYQIKNCIKSTYPLVSIVIVTFNNLTYTKLCIESVYSKTTYPNFELIVVDNASSDKTADYLTVLKQSHDNIKVIVNEKNLGFASANNIGIKKSKGEYIILLNNDTVVTKGWISGMIKHFKNPKVGMVGPVTNNVGNEAKIIVDYKIGVGDKDSSRMDFVSEHYTAKKRGKFFEIQMLSMFCVAISRRILDKVGLLDEQFSIGMFEDDDYALRVKKAGFEVRCVEDVFIYHFGSMSFGKLRPAEYQKIFNVNKEKFELKWGTKWQPHKHRN